MLPHCADPVKLVASNKMSDVKMGLGLMAINAKILNQMALARALKACQTSPPFVMSNEVMLQVGLTVMQGGCASALCSPRHTCQVPAS